jgi:cyclophilin family peptidyl-prolyl cis-trans isomerase
MIRSRLLLCLMLAVTGLASAAADAADATNRVRLTTSAGIIDLELDAARAPQTVANFLDLVDAGFYDGLIFHRVVANFVVQAGGYDASMQLREPPRRVPNESRNGLSNARGTIAMARLGDPDSAEAQFFINVNDNRHLDARPGAPGYTVFGQVVAGMEVVTEIELTDTGIDAGMAGVPTTPIVIRKATRF